MRAAFWVFMAVSMSGAAAGVYGCFFDKSETLFDADHFAWTTILAILWSCSVVALAPSAKRYLNTEDHQFTQEEISEILERVKKERK